MGKRESAAGSAAGTDRRSTGERSTDRRSSFIEQTRRAQLIDATIGLVAEVGYAGASLSRIAASAGISKAAVLYHYSSKDELVTAAYQHVIVELATEVAAAVEAVEPADGPAAYIRAMIGHLRVHPDRTRMIVESMSHESTDADPGMRWRGLRDVLVAALEARGVGDPSDDLRTAAIIIGGAIDGIVGEQLDDPDYDTAAAAEQLVAIVESSVLARDSSA